ncbi:hypothetical protein J6590_048326 [Homalodisca vitripennis]|nr:hypothetical protein J6590_048326 [Homalodisca vitripennis]
MPFSRHRASTTSNKAIRLPNESTSAQFYLAHKVAASGCYCGRVTTPGSPRDGTDNLLKLQLDILSRLRHFASRRARRGSGPGNQVVSSGCPTPPTSPWSAVVGTNYGSDLEKLATETDSLAEVTNIQPAFAVIRQP